MCRSWLPIAIAIVAWFSAGCPGQQAGSLRDPFARPAIQVDPATAAEWQVQDQVLNQNINGQCVKPDEEGGGIVCAQTADTRLQLLRNARFLCYQKRQAGDQAGHIQCLDWYTHYVRCVVGSPTSATNPGICASFERYRETEEAAPVKEKLTE